MSHISLPDLKKGFNEHPTIVYDGVCMLCSRWVQFIVRNDKRGLFRFIPMQSEKGKSLLLSATTEKLPDAVLLVAEGRYYFASDAAIEVLSRLGWQWRWVLLLKIFPRILRDVIYSIIARNRYRWFGKSDIFMLVDHEG